MLRIINNPEQNHSDAVSFGKQNGYSFHSTYISQSIASCNIVIKDYQSNIIKPLSSSILLSKRILFVNRRG